MRQSPRSHDSKNRHGTIYFYFYCIGWQAKRAACRQQVILIDRVEEEVIKLYADVQLGDEQRDEVRAFILEQLEHRQQDAEREQVRQRQRITQLSNEREKLLQAHYAGAIPLDLLRSEQQRIAAELAVAERILEASTVAQEQVRVKLDQALEFVTNCQTAYQTASANVRRWMNQVFFEQIEISDDYEIHAELALPFKVLLHAEVAKRAVAHGERRSGSHPKGTGTEQTCVRNRKPALVSRGAGSKEDLLVALTAQLSSLPYQLTHPPQAYLDLRESLRAGRQPRRPKPSAQVQRHRRLSDEEVRDLVAGYLAGDTAPQLAARFGIAKNTIYVYLKREGAPKRPYRKLRGDDLEEVLALYESGLSIRTISVTTGWGRSTIGDALHEAGQTLRPRGRPALSGEQL